MDELFTNFYNDYIQEIHDFLNSESDILYINGYSGSGKSSVLKHALNIFQADILKFHHLCFKNTVIDDILLSFYDTFRHYAIKQKISLKKNPETGFMEKVNFYFQNLDYPSVVIIDNFETVSEDSEVIDFLLHISGFQNVKIIIISKNPSCRLIEYPTVSVERIFFDKISYEKFEELINTIFEGADSSLIKEFYDATGGYELYLKMVLSYLDSLNMTLGEFLDEYKEKDISFEQFMTDKQVSLISNTYYPFLENLACINHNVPLSFMESYGLGDEKFVPYLISKYMISEFFGTYYIKSYVRNYFLDNLSLQNKVSMFNKLISIYENELEKSPKDRILRLSRECIRELIKELKEKLPKVAKINPAPAFSYVAQVKSTNPQWFVTGNMQNRSMSGRALSKRREEKQKNQAKPFEEKIIAPKPSLFETFIEKAINNEKEYKFQEAIDILKEAKTIAKTTDEKITVYSKIARNSVKINDYNSALSNLRELCEIVLTEGDIDSFARYRIEIGKIYKKLYAFSRAKNAYEEIIKKEGQISDRVLAYAHLSLGEIFELENNFDKCIEEYKKAFDLMILINDEKDPLMPEICYKLANEYDENAYYDEALVYYKNAVKYSKTSNNDVYLVKSYTNSGVILADMGNNDEASGLLLNAFELSKDGNNLTDTYYIARNIASIYKNIDNDKAYDYLLTALEYARESGNSFEIAISLLELGDFYYDSKQNEQALICYFQAKNQLGSSASKENLDRITTRINDMKVKLGDFVFRGMEELYDRSPN